MSDTAAQLRRLLAFLPQISDGQDHAIADVARQLGVDAETVTRDLHALSERFGDPPGWIEKVQVYIEAEHVSMEAPSHFQRPMRLTDAELRALQLGLSVLRAEAAPERRSGIDAAVDRLQSLRGGHAGIDVEDRAVSTGTPRNLQHVPALREALRNRRRVAVHYLRSGGDEATRRTICPFSFAVETGVWYLVAYCDSSKDIRIFRLDRIQGIELLTDSFERPSDFDVDRVLSERVAFIGAAAEKLVVRYSPRVATLNESRCTTG